MKATLYTDGGSRGNPGPAAIGFVLNVSGVDAIEIEHGETIGKTTNNQAEYRALLAGMEKAHEIGVQQLSCFLDSELVVKQLQGKYRVRDADLRPHYASISSLATHFDDVSYTHVPRARNKRADRLVNDALDNA